MMATAVEKAEGLQAATQLDLEHSYTFCGSVEFDSAEAAAVASARAQEQQQAFDASQVTMQMGASGSGTRIDIEFAASSLALLRAAVSSIYGQLLSAGGHRAAHDADGGGDGSQSPCAGTAHGE